MSSKFKPLYRTIQDHLRAEITSSELAVGAPLPSEQELAQRFATTRNTVRQALAELVFDGTVIREKGRGTFVGAPPHQSTIDTAVRQSFEEQMEARGERVCFRLLSFEPVAAPASIAQRLGVRAGSVLFSLRRIRLIGDELIGAESRFILPELARRFDSVALHEKSAIAMLEEALGGQLSDLEITVYATSADASTAALLECPPSSPVLVREHLFRDENIRPVLTGQSTFRADRYRFTYHLRDDRKL